MLNLWIRGDGKTVQGWMTCRIEIYFKGVKIRIEYMTRIFIAWDFYFGNIMCNENALKLKASFTFNITKIIIFR